jgi:F420-dependent oxidoreductase-like protein
LKLGLTLGYWMAQPPVGALERVLEAERLGFDIVFTAESWGSDAFTPLAWWGSRTTTIKLGTSIVQMSARPPTSTAMAALTLDHLSNGRFVLGLGVSGPQVVEGWYGQPFGKPLARTREYVSIVRKVLARQGPVTNDGPHYPLPYRGPGSIGLGKPLKPITHPLRPDLPVLLGAEGPKNVALAAEIADGWLPIFYSPKVAPLYNGWLSEGFARPGARRRPEEFEIMANAMVVVTDDIAGAIDALRPIISLYVGGMGAPEMNFHKDMFARIGYEAEVENVQKLFLEGRRDEAIAAIPDSMIDDVYLIGPPSRIREKVAEWQEAGVTTMVVGSTTVEELRQVAEVVLG